MNHLRPHAVFGRHVRAGKQALKGAHRADLRESRRARVEASLDFDDAAAGLRPELGRWDYLIAASHLPDALHAVEVHAFDRSALVAKKRGTQEILRQQCPEAADKVRSWNVVLRGSLPRADQVARFTADTKIRIARDLDIAQLKP